MRRACGTALSAVTKAGESDSLQRTCQFAWLRGEMCEFWVKFSRPT